MDRQFLKQQRIRFESQWTHFWLNLIWYAEKCIKLKKHQETFDLQLFIWYPEIASRDLFRDYKVERPFSSKVLLEKCLLILFNELHSIVSNVQVEKLVNLKKLVVSHKLWLDKTGIIRICHLSGNRSKKNFAYSSVRVFWVIQIEELSSRSCAINSVNRCRTHTYLD